MSIVQRIRTLAQEKDLTLAQIERALDFGNGTIARWDKSSPAVEKVDKVAKYFNVSFDYLLGISERKGHYGDSDFCPQCGFEFYNFNDSLIKKEHENYHQKYLDAVYKFGDLIGSNTIRESIKAAARKTIESKDSSLEEKYNAFIDLYKCQFSRSVQAANWSLEHIDFHTYLAMILNQESVRKYLPHDLYAKAVAEFGTLDGIDNGKTYYKVKSQTTTSTNLLDDYNQLDLHGKKLVDSIIELELQRIKSYKQSNVPYVPETLAARNPSGVLGEAEHMDLATKIKMAEKIRNEQAAGKSRQKTELDR